MPTTSVQANNTQRTVLKYVKLQFEGEWEYGGDAYSFKPVKDKANLWVVTETVGQLSTYLFVVRRRPAPSPGGFLPTDHVLVPAGENIVYIPELCAKRLKGDATKCAY